MCKGQHVVLEIMSRDEENYKSEWAKQFGESRGEALKGSTLRRCDINRRRWPT